MRFLEIVLALNQRVIMVLAMNLTENRHDIAFALNIENELIGQIRQVEDVLVFLVNGAAYDCRITKTGKVKKNSVRRA